MKKPEKMKLSLARNLVKLTDARAVTKAEYLNIPGRINPVWVIYY